MEHDLSFFDKSNLKWLKNNTIFLTVAGSHSYGTNIETSDIDYRGIAIPPNEYYYSFDKNFEQAEFKDPDCVIFDLRKFFTLAANNNPNCIEIIFTDPKDHLIVNPIMEKLFKHRQEFLCKRARYAYEGYAFAQFKRIKLHNAYLRNPIDHKPTRKEFGLPEHTVVSTEQLEAVNAMIRKKLDQWNVDFSQIDNNTRIELSEKITNIMTEVCSASIFIEKENLWKEAAVSCNINPNFVFLIQKEKEYEARAREYKQYQDWKKNRNPLRADLEANFGYDCYSDDTEFLTDYGWKLFDDILPENKLATVCVTDSTENKALDIEYQNYTDKFSGNYTGTMYNFYGYHLDLMITPNHRILQRQREKNTNKVYGWKLIAAEDVSNCFEFMMSIEPDIKGMYPNKYDYNLDIDIEDYLKLMGWYLSDGCIGFYKNNDPKVIRISQKKFGKLYAGMLDFANRIKQSAIHEYERDENVFRNYKIIEAVLSVGNSKIVNSLFDDCSCTTNKRIPRWVYKLPKNLKDIL